MYSPLIKQNQRVHEGYFHTTDILPTLARAAGIKVKNIDGFDQWDVLRNGGESPRNYVVNSLDTIYHKYSMILDEWKLVSRYLKFWSSEHCLKNLDFSGGIGEYLGEIEEFKVSDKSYANAILSSTVSMTFEDSKINPTLLTAEKLIQLRSKAIINCNEDQNPLGDCKPEEEKPCLYHIVNDPCENFQGN